MASQTFSSIQEARERFKGLPSIERSRVAYFVGLDLGQSHDPTAVAIVRLTVDEIERTGSAFASSLPRRHEQRSYDTVHLERFPLGTSYVDVAGRVAVMLDRDPLRSTPGTRLIVDATGVGRPVCDILRRAGLKFDEVTITSGDGETCEGRHFRVAKLRLVSRLQALLHASELRIAASLPDAAVLVRELQDFRATIGDSGRASFNAREGTHDDLVLALALSCWGAEREHRSRARMFTYRM